MTYKNISIFMKTTAPSLLQPIVRPQDIGKISSTRKSPTVLPPLRGINASNSMGAQQNLSSTSTLSPHNSNKSINKNENDRSSDLHRNPSPFSKLSDSLCKTKSGSVGWLLRDNMEVANIDDTSMIVPSCQIQSQEIIVSVPGYFCYCSSSSLFIYQILSTPSGKKPLFKLVRIITLPGHHILSVTADRKTMLVAISSMDHRIHLYSLLTGEPTQDVILELKTPPVSIKFHPNIQHSLFLLHYSKEGEGELRLIHSVTGKSVVVKNGLEKALSLTCSPYSKEIAISFESGEIMVIGLSADGTEEIYSRSLISGAFTSKLPDLVTWNSKHNTVKTKSETIKSNIKYVRKLIHYVSSTLLKPVEPISVSYDLTNHETLLVVFAFGLHCLFNTATGDCLVIYFAREGRQLDTARLRNYFNIGTIDAILNNADSKNMFTPTGTLPNGVTSCAFLPGEAGKFITTDCDVGIVRTWSVSNSYDLSAHRISTTAISGVFIVELDPSLQNEPIVSTHFPINLTITNPSTTSSQLFVLALVDSYGGISIYSNDFRDNILHIPSSHHDRVYSLSYDPFNPKVFCTAGSDGIIKQWHIDFMADQYVSNASTFMCDTKQYQRTLVAYNAVGRFKTWKANEHGKVATTKLPPCVSLIYAPIDNVPYVLCSYINGDIRFFQKHSGRHTCDLISASSFYDAGLLIPRKHHFFSEYDKGFIQNMFNFTFNITYATSLAWSDLKPQLIVTGWTDGCLRFFLANRCIHESTIEADELVMSFRLMAVFSIPWFLSAPSYDGFKIRALRFIPGTLVLVTALESGHMLFINVQPLLSKTIYSLFNMCYEIDSNKSSNFTYSAITNDQTVAEEDRNDTISMDDKLYRQFKPLFTETTSIFTNKSNIFVFNLTISYKYHLEHRSVIFQHSSYTTTLIQHHNGTPRRICCLDLHPRMRAGNDTDEYNLLALGDSMGTVTILHIDPNIYLGRLAEGRVLIKHIYTCLGTIGNRPTHNKRIGFIRALKFIYEIPTCILLSASSGDFQLVDYTLSRCMAQAKSLKIHNSEVLSMDIHQRNPYTCVVACQDNSIRQFSLLSCGVGMPFLSFLSLKYLWSVFTNRSVNEFATSVLDKNPFNNALFDDESVDAIGSIIDKYVGTDVDTEHKTKLSSHLSSLTTLFASIGTFFHTNQSLTSTVVALIQEETTPYTPSPAYGYLHIVRRVEAIISVLLPDVMQVCQVPMFPTLEEEITRAYQHICVTCASSTTVGVHQMISQIKERIGCTVRIYNLGTDVCLKDVPQSVSNNITNKLRYVIQLILLSHNYTLLSDVLWQFGFYNEALQVSMTSNNKDRWLSQLVHEAEEVARQGGFLLHRSISTTAQAASDICLREVISQNKDRYYLNNAIPSDFGTILYTDPASLAIHLLSEGRYGEAKIVLSFAIYSACSTHKLTEFNMLYGGSDSTTLDSPSLQSHIPSSENPSLNTYMLNSLYMTASLNISASYCDTRQPLAAVCELLVTRSYDQAIRILLLNRSTFLLIILLTTLIKVGENDPRLLIPQKMYPASCLHSDDLATSTDSTWNSSDAIHRYKALLVAIAIESHYTYVNTSIFSTDEPDCEAEYNYPLDPLLSASIGQLYTEIKNIPFDKSGILGPKCLTVGDVIMRYTGNYDSKCAEQLDENILLEHLSSIQGCIEFTDEPDAFSSFTGPACKISFRVLVHAIMKKLTAELQGGCSETNYALSPSLPSPLALALLDNQSNSNIASSELLKPASTVVISSVVAEPAAKPILPVRRLTARSSDLITEQTVNSEKIGNQEEEKEITEQNSSVQLEQQPKLAIQSNIIGDNDDDELGDNTVFHLDVDPGYGYPNDDDHHCSISNIYRHPLIPVLDQTKDGDLLPGMSERATYIALNTYDLISKIILKIPITKTNWSTLSPYITFLAKCLPCTGIQRIYLPSTMPHICICFLAAAGCSFLYGQNNTARTIAIALNRTTVKHPETEVFSIKEIVKDILDRRASVPPVSINGDRPLLYKGETYFDNSDGRCFSLFLFFDKYMRWGTSILL